MHLWFKESLCTTSGKDCHKLLIEIKSKCLAPCEGIFADVQKMTNRESSEDIGDLKTLVDEYEGFKKGFTNRGEYHEEIAGKECSLN